MSTRKKKHKTYLDVFVVGAFQFSHRLTQLGMRPRGVDDFRGDWGKYSIMFIIYAIYLHI